MISFLTVSHQYASVSTTNRHCSVGGYLVVCKVVNHIAGSTVELRGSGVLLGIFPKLIYTPKDEFRPLSVDRGKFTFPSA